MAAGRRRQVVPASRQMLNELKYEIAAEFGYPVVGVNAGGMDTEFASELGTQQGSQGGSIPWGQLTSRENGSIGGEITKRLVSNAEKELYNLN